MRTTSVINSNIIILQIFYARHFDLLSRVSCKVYSASSGQLGEKLCHMYYVICHVLQTCAQQQADVVTDIANISLSKEAVPPRLLRDSHYWPCT